MKAAVVREFGARLQIEERPVRRPGRNEILVKIVTSGVCHTDLHAVEGDWPAKPKMPLVPGHEGLGYVAAVGEEVTNVKEGDIVGVPWLHDACGYCEHCITGWETLCASQHNTGYGVDGSYAEYVIADARYVGRLSGAVNFLEMAPILCAGVTVYKGLKETDTRPGQWVGISGVGGLGHVAVQYAKAMGLHVVAVDVADDKIDLAKRLGADLAYNAKTTENLGAVVQRETGGGLHGMLVTAVSPVAFSQGLDTLRRGGTMALVGLPPGSFELPIFQTVLFRHTIRGSIVGTRKDLQEALDFATEGKVKATVHSRKLDEINEVFDEMRQGEIEGRMVLEIGAA